jgi:hypothetical protein
LPAQLGGQIVGNAPRAQAEEGGTVQFVDDDLGVALAERETAAQPLDLVARRVLEHAQHVRGLTRSLAAHLHDLADRPEAEQPDAVLPLEHELAPLLRGQVALARVADMGGDVGERFGAIHLRDDAVAVVEHV